VLDLGSGIGSVGMIAAWRFQAQRFVTVEAQAESVALARRSAEYNGLTSATRFVLETSATQV
jgi:tRNA1(Val) A37 N6-methylase TrmN6